MPSQKLDLQIDVLQTAGCECIFSEKISSRKKRRPQLTLLKKSLRPGDEVVVFKIDRLGRSLKDLLDIITFLDDLNVRFVSLQDGIDTATTGSRLLLNIMMCIADFEREMIRERTLAGLASAKNRGVKLGRPKGLSPEAEQIRKEVISLHHEGNSAAMISNLVKLSKPTVYRYIRMG